MLLVLKSVFFPLLIRAYSNRLYGASHADAHFAKRPTCLCGHSSVRATEIRPKEGGGGGIEMKYHATMLCGFDT